MNDWETYRADFASTAGIETMRTRFLAATATAIGVDELPVQMPLVLSEDPQLVRQNRSAVTCTVEIRDVTVVLSTLMDNNERAHIADCPSAYGLYNIAVTADGRIGIISTAERVIVGILDVLEGIRPVAFPDGLGIRIWTEPGEDEYIVAAAHLRGGR